jgi:hypothetical protein
MGKKSARNRNTNNKKKIVNSYSNVKKECQNFLILQKMSQQGKELADFSVNLQKSLNELIFTFRSRLSGSDSLYEVTLKSFQSLQVEKIDEILTGVIIEFTEELYQEIKQCAGINVFLIESFKCIKSAGNLLNPLSKNDAVLKICKLSYFHKIMKQAVDSPNSDKFSNQVKILYNELSSFSSSFKDHNLLPIEKLVSFFRVTSASKEFAKNCVKLINEETASENSFDSEIEEFMNRLDKCQMLVNRNRPLVSQEWINLLKKQLSQKH